MEIRKRNMQEWQSLNRRQVHHSKVWDPEFIHAISDRQKVSPYDKQESADQINVPDKNGQHLVAHNGTKSYVERHTPGAKSCVERHTPDAEFREMERNSR